LSVMVAGAAIIAGVQLGVNAPAVSPVQPPSASVRTAPNNPPVMAAPNQQELPAPAKDKTDGARRRGGR
jgi:hypothetical protein